MTTGTSPTTEPPTGLPPAIIQLQPPLRPGTRPAVMWLVVVGLSAIAVGSATILWDSPLALLSVGYAALGLIALWRFRRGNSIYRETHARFLTQLASQDEQLADEFRRLWSKRYVVPDQHRIVEVLVRLARYGPPRARIFYFGQWEVPEPDDFRFEPEVISSVRRRARQFRAIPLAGVAFLLLCATFLVGHWAVLPLLFAFLGAFLAFFAVSVWVAIVRFFEFFCRSAYLRLAPGVIQVLRYSAGKRKPRISSFPIEAGTTVLVEGRWLINCIMLARGDLPESVRLTFVKNPAHVSGRIWMALLSTAPTPPLSDEELVA
jgi:hypothetical protein